MRSIKILFVLIFIFTASISGYADCHHHEKKSGCNVSCSHGERRVNSQSAQTVYFCTGAYSYAYHSISNCPGLSNCGGQIRYVDENYAINVLGRVPCCRCWSNVAGRCKDDNPYYAGGGGGDDSEAYAILALGIVVASAAILSNDIYVYPAYSFYKGEGNYSSFPSFSNPSISTGWLMGFRKKFKHSALEYGASYLKSEFQNKYRLGYEYPNYIDRWGVHFNFVHHVFYNKTPEWLKVYFGPSVNYVYDFGFGGVIGKEIRLFDRLKFDVRYEWTTQTNQVQAGLIFTYQKKYLWQK
jgi:hypothetical protein